MQSRQTLRMWQEPPQTLTVGQGEGPRGVVAHKVEGTGQVQASLTPRCCPSVEGEL